MPDTGTTANCPHQQAGKKRACNRTQAEGPNPEAADPVARCNDQEQREFRVADQELLEPG
jgi:hypothetical protein